MLVKAAHAWKAPANRELQELAALPYCFVTMWLAAARAGVTRQNADGKEILVHGAARGLGTLALQTLSEWGARVTAIAKASDLPACLEAGAAKVVERERNPFANFRGAFDATSSTSPRGTMSSKLLSCLREGALGQATTVHPLVQNFDEGGWVAGALRTIQQKTKMRAALREEQAITRGFCFDRNAKRFRKWRGSSSSVGALFRSKSRPPLREAAKAFDHMRRHAPGRALLIP